MHIRWSNVPLPETHITTLIIAMALHRAMPVRRLPGRGPRSVPGWATLVTGVLLAGWVVRAIGEREIATPSQLITTGPYAWSRNPMYVAWVLIDIGLALLLNSVWIRLCLPAALITTHRVIRQEERQLEARFGDEYRRYRARVRRYL